MNLLKDSIIFIVWDVCFFVVFFCFLFGILLKISSSTPSIGEFFSRYSDINKFKRLNPPKIKKSSLERQVAKATSSIRKSFTLLNINYNTTYIVKCRNKMNLNKETSHKSCQLNDFRDSLEHFFFSKYQDLLNDPAKAYYENFSGINFSYTSRLHFLLVIKVPLWQKN